MRSSFRPSDYDLYNYYDQKSPKYKSKVWGHKQLNDFHYDIDQNPINLSEINDAIDSLVKYQELNLAEALADPSLARKYALLLRAAKRFHGTEFYDSYIVDKLRSKNILTVRPGTLGQALFGNLIENRNENANCSPIQIGALPANDQLLGNCHNQVWYYDGDIFRQLTSEVYPPPPNADLYIPDPSFFGLNYEQVKILKSYGVQQVTFYTVKRIESNQATNNIVMQTIKLGDSTPIESVMTRKMDTYSHNSTIDWNKKSTSSDSISKQEFNEQCDESMIPGFNLSTVLIIIIIISIIIVLLIAAYYLGSRHAQFKIDTVVNPNK